ncbi:hypothetical protein B2G71_19525 [Novosphingobium sp. PC22D]|nr:MULTISPECIES: hypothetical protein [Novosphingobium]MCJ2180085.1 hypothetical protein [Novosphingobium album (ex Hu et al. 2023)]PEQ11005.1 hypothetical protein B2G71_19525 [Novosphingobium sp. PC22D]
MNQAALIAWTSLYIAVGCMALICGALAAVATFLDLFQGKWRPSFATRLDIALALPKIWLRWQRNYLLGTPVIAFIALYFAYHVGFDVFWNIEPTG